MLKVSLEIDFNNVMNLYLIKSQYMYQISQSHILI